ncbi:leucine-rich repeat domain-containing protein [Wenyingzhuangia sp. IMCC45467]
MNISTSTIKKIAKSISFNLEGITYQTTSLSTVKIIQSKNKLYSGALTIPESITYKGINYIVHKIGTSAFANNFDLNNITLPNTICEIEEKAFANNPNLVQVVSNITSPQPFHKTAFNHISESCKLIVPTAYLTAYKTSDILDKFSLVTDVLPFTIAGITYEKTSETTVKVIKNFDNVYAKSITIPNTVSYNKTNFNVTEISDTAFKNNESITAISIGNNITTIKAFSFSNCKNLSSISMSNSISSIEKSAFSSSGLTSFTFPYSITTIESHLFIGCEDLSTVTIPNSITTIKEYSFGWCAKLTTLICNIKDPLTIHSNVFFGTRINNCTLKVLNNLETYKIANVWKGFKIMKSSTTLDS